MVFAINEPNLRGQAFLSPWDTAALYRKIKVIADKHDIPMVGPHMALGSAPGDSITALDPIENKVIAYTFMIPFLKATLYYLNHWGITPPAVGIHSYGGFGELKWSVELIHATFGCEVWVTEYAQWNSSTHGGVEGIPGRSHRLSRTHPVCHGIRIFQGARAGQPEHLPAGTGAGQAEPAGETYVSLPAE